VDAEGKHAAAVPLLQQSLDVYRKSGAVDSIQIVDPLTHLAAAQIGLNKPKLAIPLAEQALTILGKHHSYAGQTAWTRFTLARALTAAHQDPTRAADLARQAKDEFQKAAPWKKWPLDAVTAWMKQHKIK
jgi:hypothetical protein